MKNIINILFVIFPFLSFAQDSININGIYHSNYSFNGSTIEFRPSGYFQEKIYHCRGKKIITGIYKICGDTINLFGLQNDTLIKQKFLIRKIAFAEFKFLKNRYSLKKINGGNYGCNTSDSICDYSLYHKISVGYYFTGEKEFLIDKINENKFDIYYYYKNAQLRVIEHYKKGLKFGKWIYYDENGKRLK